MSYSIKGNAITLTRGDTFRVKVKVTKKDPITGIREPYEPTGNDKVRFALKHPTLNSSRTEFTDAKALILKDIPTNTMILTLDPEDTKPLGFGRYVYDIQLTFPDGTVDTFITKESFKLTEEVE